MPKLEKERLYAEIVLFGLGVARRRFLARSRRRLALRRGLGAALGGARGASARAPWLRALVVIVAAHARVEFFDQVQIVDAQRAVFGGLGQRGRLVGSRFPGV